MDPELSLLGIELIVDDLDRAVELFVDVFGCPMLSRGPSALVAGESAVIDLGRVVLTLLAPAATGEGSVLAERAPRLSQFVFSSETTHDGSTDARPILRRAIERGVAVVPLDNGSFYLTPESVQGALGQAVAMVVTGPAPA